MEFLLLGPVEVRCGGQRVPVGGPQAEKALAALLLARGRVVGLDALVTPVMRWISRTLRSRP